MNIKRDTEKCYCVGFRRAAKAITGYYDRILLSSGITLTQYSLLINLFKIAPCSTSVLAKAMKLERTTLVRNIKPLVAVGLIQDLAKEGERDRQLTMTKAGLRSLESAQTLWEEAQAGLKEYIGERDFKKVMNIITTFEQLV